LFWLLWIGVWVAVSFNIGSFGAYLMAEKILYTASIGICALLVKTLTPFMVKQRKAATICLLLLVSASIYHAWHRISYWQDTRTYLQQALEHAPEFYLAHYVLAGIDLSEKNYDRAKVYLEKTVELEPGFSAALSSLGNLHYLNGDVKYALRYWERAISNDPTNPMPYFNVGLALRKLGMIEESRPYFEGYLENEPNPSPSVLKRLEAFGY
jgi:tetratricopeptide (TPR) repeat protein